MKKSGIILLSAYLLLLSGCKKNDGTDIVPEERGFGLIPTPDSILELIPEVDTSLLFDEGERIMNWVAPPSFSLDMPPIKSQGGEGSCVAFATAYAARSYRLHIHSGNSYTNLRGEPDNYAVFSPEFLYNISKSPGDCNAGTRFYRALDEIKSKGVCTWQRMPYFSNNGCTTLPNSTQLAEAAFFKIESYYRVSNISDIKRIVYSQNPIIIGVKLDLGFWLDGNFIWNGPRGRFVGNHAIVICGWDDSKNAYKIMNSYGTDWGFGGYGWIGYDYLDNVLLGAPGRYEMYVMKTKATDSRLMDISTSALSNLTPTSVTSGGTINSNAGPPINKRGIQRYRLLNFGLGSLIVDPVFIDDATSGLGSYTLTAGGLTPNTNYRVRAFAKTAWGTFYGTPISFTTPADPTVPVLSTTNVSNINATTASSGGNITSDGGAAITARGVCWSTSPNPTTSDNKTTDGTGTGTFSSNMNNLQWDTRYYVRAYATNSVGTAYGNEISFIPVHAGCGTVTDIDGNVYQTVTIGTQCWMKENLKTTRYRDGTAIPNVTDSLAWAINTTGAYSHYNNNSANNSTYGKLYNWYAVSNSKNICPIGWHVPSDTEWSTLVNFLGGESVAGGKMKATSVWDSPNTGATNSSGFKGIPGGYRAEYFYNIGGEALFWTSDNFSSSVTINITLNTFNSEALRNGSLKYVGGSVRCVKD